MHRTFSRTVLLTVATLLGPGGPALAEQTVGLFINDPAAFDGYTLFAPFQSSKTYLIDNEGRSIHTWDSQLRVAGANCLLEDGSLLRVTTAGLVLRIGWDGA